MPQHRLGAQDALFYEHRPPQGDGLTFVFFNALTGDASTWRGAVAPALQGDGHGTLLWNLRGQADSPCDPGMPFTAAQITDDARALLTALKPARPVYVGLSIGGLFALRAHLEGCPARGFVLINTLRKVGPRIAWLNDALARCAAVGGLELLRDLYLPLLTGEDWQAANRDGFLKDGGYAPLPADAPAARLLAASASADWDVPYEDVDAPAVVLTGLQDRLFLDADDVAALAARLPRAERVDRPRAGHLLPMEEPAAVVDACRTLAERV